MASVRLASPDDVIGRNRCPPVDSAPGAAFRRQATGAPRKNGTLIPVSRDPETVQSPAVLSKRHQGPLPLHLLQAAQQESPESHRLLHDPEHRFHGLFA